MTPNLNCPFKKSAVDPTGASCATDGGALDRSQLLVRDFDDTPRTTGGACNGWSMGAEEFE